MTRKTGTILEDQYTCLIIPRSILLGMRNVSDKVVGKTETYIWWSKIFFENRAVYEMTCKNTVDPDTPQVTVWSTRIASWIPKATNTHSGYEILIAFPLQQWFHKLVSMLRYPCIVCLVITQVWNLDLLSPWNRDINLLKTNDIYIYIYIYMPYRSANLQTLRFKYLFNKYTYWIF